MKIPRLAVSALAISLLAANAYALEVDDSVKNPNNPANLADPDDKTPYPHFDDNGQLQSSQSVNLSAGPGQAMFSGPSNLAPSSDGFNRAVDNQK